MAYARVSPRVTLQTFAAVVQGKDAKKVPAFSAFLHFCIFRLSFAETDVGSDAFGILQGICV